MSGCTLTDYAKQVTMIAKKLDSEIRHTAINKLFIVTGHVELGYKRYADAMISAQDWITENVGVSADFTHMLTKE